jgi:acrylyl-CoA reductase (NADPH)
MTRPPFPVTRRCWLVTRDEHGHVAGGVVERAAGPPDPGRLVSIAVEAAGFNYKDALACAGHPGVMRTSPLVPGIDAAGTLLEPVGDLAVGSAVVATGHGLGERLDGGFATVVQAPVEAVLPRDPALAAADAMALGTAGLTVLLACDRLVALVHGPLETPAGDAGPEGEWLVTGASGGVGMIAVAFLASQGRRVVACTRKPDARTALAGLGAAVVATPEEIVDPAEKSLARGRWVGVIDTVGGPLLAAVLRSVRPGGAVAAIGMTGGVRLDTTVHPFILRGVTLAGIDAAALPTPADRRLLWHRLAAFWPAVGARLPVTRLALGDVGHWAERMLGGTSAGRAVVIP